MIVRIKRQNDQKSPAYWQSFDYNGPKHVTVSAVLDALNYTDDLFDIEGNPEGGENSTETTPPTESTETPSSETYPSPLKAPSRTSVVLVGSVVPRGAI